MLRKCELLITFLKIDSYKRHKSFAVNVFTTVVKHIITNSDSYILCSVTSSQKQSCIPEIIRKPIVIIYVYPKLLQFGGELNFRNRINQNEPAGSVSKGFVTAKCIISWFYTNVTSLQSDSCGYILIELVNRTGSDCNIGKSASNIQS